ncbi:MAG: TlpA disulfide reductase family protein [Planctomycetota bacterium]|jgi:peroxiredoxin
MKHLLFKAVLLCWLCFFLCGCGGDNDKISTGDIAKDFRLDTLAHERFYLNQQKKKVVVLVFWTTWCNVCKAELVALKSLKDMPNSENLVIAGICSDPENINEARQIAENLNIDYPLLLDKSRIVTTRYNISVFPTTIVIDQRGIVRFIRREYNSAIINQVKTKVESLFDSDERTE